MNRSSGIMLSLQRSVCSGELFPARASSALREFSPLALILRLRGLAALPSDDPVYRID